MGENNLILLWVVCQKLRNLWHFEFWLTQDHIGLEISKCYSSYSFHPMSVKCHEDIGYHGRIQAITFLGNRPSLKKLWHFKILTWESMGKPKMWNISKTVDRRANQTKIWDLGCYSVHMEGALDARFLEFGLGSFGTLPGFTIFKTAPFPIFIQALYKVS